MVEETTAPKEEVATGESAAQESETQKTDETQKDSGQVPRTVMNEKIEKRNQQIADGEAKLAEAEAKIAELEPLADNNRKHESLLQRYPHKREEMVRLSSDNLNPGAAPKQDRATNPAMANEALA